MPDQHALLSASSSSRWLHCPPSARWCAGLADKPSSFAEEGTKAHSLAESRLRYYLTYGRLVQEKPSYVDTEMWEATERYVDIVIEKTVAARKETPDAEVLIEHRLDFSHWVPGGFGTGDAVIVSDKGIEIVDLKYGKGVPVSAQNNSQMRLYALGAYADLSLLYAIDLVTMTIVQPRLDSVSSETVTAKNLLAWGDTIAPIAKMAYEGKGKAEAGPHCRFCLMRPKCRILKDYLTKDLKVPENPEALTGEEIAQVVLKTKDQRHQGLADFRRNLCPGGSSQRRGMARTESGGRQGFPEDRRQRSSFRSSSGRRLQAG